MGYFVLIVITPTFTQGAQVKINFKCFFFFFPLSTVVGKYGYAGFTHFLQVRLAHLEK